MAVVSTLKTHFCTFQLRAFIRTSNVGSLTCLMFLSALCDGLWLTNEGTELPARAGVTSVNKRHDEVKEE